MIVDPVIQQTLVELTQCLKFGSLSSVLSDQISLLEKSRQFYAQNKMHPIVIKTNKASNNLNAAEYSRRGVVQ